MKKHQAVNHHNVLTLSPYIIHVSNNLYARKSRIEDEC